MIYWQNLAHKINLRLTEKQEYIVNNAKRFNVIVGGKRVGKTVLVAFLALLELWKTDRVIWVVTPSYELGERIFDKLVPWISRFMPEMVESGHLKTYRTPGRVAIDNRVTNSKIEFKSANTETSLKGEALDLVIIDEAGDIDQHVWQEFILPNIRERRPSGELGKAFLIGNANFFGSWWHSMTLSKDDETFAYHLPTLKKVDGQWQSNNPEIISTEEILKDLHQVPEPIWNKNYLAEFIPGQGRVFSNILECAGGQLESPKPDKFYYVGLDLGRLQDYTVITVVDSKTYNVVYWERFKDIEYPFQKKKILEVIKGYGVTNTKTLVDQTGLGQPITDDLAREGISIEGYTLSNQSKKDLIEKLSMFLEQGRISYPKIPELINELQVFSYKLSENNRVQYGAPSGYHDDCVISLALAIKDLEGWPNRLKTPQMTQQELVKASSKFEINGLLSLEEKPIIKPYSVL